MKKDPIAFRVANDKNIRVLESKVIKLSYDYDNWQVIHTVRQMAEEEGFHDTDEAMIATAASELATNILRYAGSGEIMLCGIQNVSCGEVGIEVQALDHGPGIENIELAMEEKFSSHPNSLGLGLPSVKRIADEFFVESVVGKGTLVVIRKWKRQ